MDHKIIIEAIISTYLDLIDNNVEPNKTRKLKNGERFTWDLPHGTSLTVDQIDEPEDTFYKVECEAFTLTLHEDSVDKKYKLDAPEIKNDETLGAWVGQAFMKAKQKENPHTK